MKRRPTKASIKEQKKKAEKAGNVRFYRRLFIIECIFIFQMTIKATAEKLDISPTTAQKWKTRYEESGFDGLFDLPRSGRPPKVPRKVMKKIRRWAHKKPRSSLDMFEKIDDMTGVCYSMGHAGI